MKVIDIEDNLEMTSNVWDLQKECIQINSGRIYLNNNNQCNTIKTFHIPAFIQPKSMYNEIYCTIMAIWSSFGKLGRFRYFLEQKIY